MPERNRGNPFIPLRHPNKALLTSEESEFPQVRQSYYKAPWSASNLIYATSRFTSMSPSTRRKAVQGIDTWNSKPLELNNPVLAMLIEISDASPSNCPSKRIVCFFTSDVDGPVTLVTEPRAT